MPVLRRGSASSRNGRSSRPPGVKELLATTSPYGSRRLVVETDGVASAAYLKDSRDEVVGAAWIANHRQAAHGLDLARLNAGRVPTMPVTRTRHPEGREPLDTATLEVVWFEEGDGAALLEEGEPLCVIPAWSDMGRGIPGYSIEATAQSPFAFPLDEELEEFRPRIAGSRAYWEWRAAEGSWGGFQQSALGHLLGRLGPGGYYWHDVGRQFRGPATELAPGASKDGTPAARNGAPGRNVAGGRNGAAGRHGSAGRNGAAARGLSAGRGAAADQESGGVAAPAPVVGVSERPARGDRTYSVLSTLGMSCQRMPTVELYEDDVTGYARIELALATTLPSPRAGSIFPWLAHYPWRSVTWFAPGDVVQWYHEPGTFPLNKPGSPPWEGVLLLDDPARLDGPPAPDLSGFTFGGEPVRWLWLVPITDEERLYAKSEGSNALILRLANAGRTWVIS